MKVRVVKLGGSLLVRRDWPNRLRNWLSVHREASSLIVVGGGEMVESIRELDRVHSLSTEFVHWLCIDLLTHTAQIAGQLLPEFPVIESRDELQNWQLTAARVNHWQVAIVMVTAFYDREMHDYRLPKTWSTTSDSLAALLAKQIDASELVLVKSTEVADFEFAGTLAKKFSAADLSAAGIVDAAFPCIIDDCLPVTIVNLTDKESFS